ncbi:putative bifunctional diguanylate cyclase/phosphodiesterase [Erwinia sp. CGal63]|uniref:putative bifunctional diguanylate cyclase/phosphodiesterase n=1 Tax=Erwinia sp. CGal63 TaxID=2919889 RepID=UPI003009E5E5
MLNIATIFLLSTLWEWGLEESISTLFGLGYSADFEYGERMRFILTSSAFAMLAMIIPGLLIARLIRKMMTAEKEALRLADTDELTGVGNRRAFSARIARLDAAGLPYVLTLLDINDFKSINDLHGHHQGDAALVSLARLLAEFVGPDTHAFRIGGDEFAMISGKAQPEEAIAMATSLRRRAGEIPTGPDMFLGVSVGIACSTSSGRSGIVRAADLAMYEAKRDKTQPLVHFSPDMEQRFLQREKLEYEVAEAVKRHAIIPFLQPIVCLQTGRITGFEILARWIPGPDKVIAPAVFIPVVERLGLMDSLTLELLQAVVLVTADWPAGLHLSLNITPEQLLNSVLTECLATIMQQAERLKLELEITEQNVMTISDEARRATRDLRDCGISVALDDFGTGYSNLSVLLGLGITRLKIDRSFIATVAHASQQQKVVETLLSLCQELQITVTAEGIEDAATLEWLQKRGCDYGQGYLFSRPIPAEQATALLTSDYFVNEPVPAQ